ncbi:Tellurite resistance protein TerB [Pigmentiphaga humi]|uniref:Tellurite resistance protein TerB n=1 Tax=Pigmentiphaga humi TaxID=2478468 RepID=A0A3P4B852_9BURK|nr:TerB N-terminal domain-containing protein [Pigmentiphaga humi]VCU72413.1 Tellurite resistance protein TerB [Pigmentiphaga humi]
MARRKKSGAGGGIGAVVVGLLVGLLVLLAAIPREIWIGVGVLAAIGVGIYLYLKSKGGAKEVPQEVARPARAVVRPERRAPVAPSPAVSSRAASRLHEDEQPVSVVASPAPATPSFRIPAAPKRFGPGAWISAGEAVEVGGVSIPGGLIYVGTSLPTPSGGNDPCLIDPSKSVASNGDYTERRMGYWPSYSEISSSARRAYLNWLAGGRQDPEADVGYVFIFFYGLERRAILDASKDDAAKADWPVIAAELRRLLDIYGDKSGSFRSYAGSLLDWVSLAEHPEKAYLKPIPSFPKTYELPLYIRVALGQAAVDGVPVPAQLALAWAKLDPTNYLRTPATRCPEEFDKLFVSKYHEIFEQGLALPRNKTKIKLVHRPASAGFRGYTDLTLSFGNTPDVTVLTAPINKLRQVVEAATKELEPFSRYVGRNPDGRHALEGLLQLPATLWPEGAQKALHDLKARMGEGMIAMSFQELLGSLDAKTTLTRDRTLALARALESLNIGIEPDVLGGAKLPKPDEKVVLFAVPPGEAASRSTPSYQAAVLTLDLASAVAAADGEFSVQEMAHLRAQVQSWAHLTPNHVRRLLAHLRLLMTTPVSLTALRKKLEPLDAASKETIAAFMATVAQSDGDVSPTEVKMLEKVYKALGVEPKKVFSDVHAVAAGAKSTATTVAKVEETGFKLDPARIAALQKDTEAVSALLSGIFKEENSPEPVLVEPEPEGDTEATSPGLLGLDEAHSALARLLLSRPEWTKDELGDAAADLDLMVDGAIEALNEAAFDLHDIPFTEGEDVVTVNPELLEKLEA